MASRSESGTAASESVRFEAMGSSSPSLSVAVVVPVALTFSLALAVDGHAATKSCSAVATLRPAT